MEHGDTHRVVAPGDGLRGEAVPLGAQQEGQLVRTGQRGFLDGDGAVIQGQGRRLKPQFLQAGEAGGGPRPVDPGPGDLEHRPHAHPDGAPVKRVAAGGGRQHGVHPQGGGAAEDGPHVAGVGDVLQHRDPPGVSAQVLHGGEGRAAHGAQHPPGEGIAGELGEDLPVGGVDGHVPAPVLELLGKGGELPPLHKEGDRPAAGVQGAGDDLGALGDEDALLRVPAAAQLGVGELDVGPQLRCMDVCDLKNMGHTAPPDPPLGKGMFFSVYQSFPHPSTPGWGGGSRAAAFLPLQRPPSRGTLN